MEFESPPARVSDRDLLLRHEAGDRTAFETLYDRYAQPLFFYLHSLTEDRPLAEDLLQDCFLRVLRQSPFRLQESVGRLLYAIARNLALDEARRASVRQRSRPALEPADEKDAEAAERMEALSRALHALPVEQREVLVLKFHADLTFAQIAEVTGSHEPTVKSRYRYAIQKLEDFLSEGSESP